LKRKNNKSTSMTPKNIFDYKQWFQYSKTIYIW
jgi:hypothetical protein